MTLEETVKRIQKAFPLVDWRVSNLMVEDDETFYRIFTVRQQMRKTPFLIKQNVFDVVTFDYSPNDPECIRWGLGEIDSSSEISFDASGNDDLEESINQFKTFMDAYWYNEN